MKISELRDRYTGFCAAVLGGGPSLPGDLARVPADAVLIAVNYHALELVPGADFMVYNDAPERDERMVAAIAKIRQGKGKKTILVSPDPSSDVEFDAPVWTGFLSSNTAAWLALWMGCNPVILCGMDCYQGERTYFHEYEGDEPAWHYPLDIHLRPWIEEGRNLLPHKERLFVMSGPLQQVFPAWPSRPDGAQGAEAAWRGGQA
jgi:hypothetical protein